MYRLASAAFTCLSSSLPSYFVSFYCHCIECFCHCRTSSPCYSCCQFSFINDYLNTQLFTFCVCTYLFDCMHEFCITYYILDRVGFVGIIIMSISMFFIIWFKYIALQNSLCSLITYEFIIKLYNAFLVAVICYHLNRLKSSIWIIYSFNCESGGPTRFCYVNRD